MLSAATRSAARHVAANARPTREALRASSASFSSAKNNQTSAGVIAEPFVPAPVEGVPSLFTPGGWRYRSRQVRRGLKSTYAAAKIRQKLPDFQPNTIGDEAEQIFTSLQSAYLSGKYAKLRGLVTESMYGSLKTGAKRKWALTNTLEHPLEFVRIADPATLLQMRLVPVDANDKEKIFAQVTVKINSEQRRSTRFLLPPKSKNARKGQSQEGEWREALDENSGRAYYWHTGTEQTTWEKPAAYGTKLNSSLYSGLNEDILAVNSEHEIHTDKDQKANEMVYNVTNYIVLERAFHIPSSEWRICKL